MNYQSRNWNDIDRPLLTKWDKINLIVLLLLIYFSHHKKQSMQDPNTPQEEATAPAEDQVAEQTSNTEIAGASELVD